MGQLLEAIQELDEGSSQPGSPQVEREDENVPPSSGPFEGYDLCWGYVSTDVSSYLPFLQTIYALKSQLILPFHPILGFLRWRFGRCCRWDRWSCRLSGGAVSMVILYDLSMNIWLTILSLLAFIRVAPAEALEACQMVPTWQHCKVSELHLHSLIDVHRLTRTLVWYH